MGMKTARMMYQGGLVNFFSYRSLNLQSNLKNINIVRKNAIYNKFNTLNKNSSLKRDLRVNARFARINSENFCDGVAHMLVVANVLSTIFDTINITGPILVLAIILNDKDSNGHLLLHTWGTSYFIAKMEADEIRPKLYTLYGNSIDQYSFDVEAYSIMDYAERY